MALSNDAALGHFIHQLVTVHHLHH